MSGPLRLALDCATEHLAMALVDADGRVVAERSSAVGRRHAALLPGALDDLLGVVDGDRSRLKSLCVGVGPGSYTGIRVAIATARGLARALGVELSGVSTFVGLAALALAPGSTGVVTLDARRGNVYAQVCRHEEGSGVGTAALVTTLSEPTKVPAKALPELFPGLMVAPAGGLSAAALARSEQTTAPTPVYL